MTGLFFIMKSIEDIRHFRQTHDYIPVGGIHESVFRSYQILERVKTMLARGDSRETIAEIIAECERAEDNKEDGNYPDRIELDYRGMSIAIHKVDNGWKGIFYKYPDGVAQVFWGANIENARSQFERLVDEHLSTKKL